MQLAIIAIHQMRGSLSSGHPFCPGFCAQYLATVMPCVQARQEAVIALQQIRGFSGQPTVFGF